MPLDEVTDVLWEPVLRKYDESPIGQTMEKRVEPAPMIEQQEIQAAKGGSPNRELGEQSRKVVHHTLRFPRRTGGEEHEAWYMSVAERPNELVGSTRGQPLYRD